MHVSFGHYHSLLYLNLDGGDLADNGGITYTCWLLCDVSTSDSVSLSWYLLLDVLCLLMTEAKMTLYDLEERHRHQ